MLILISLLFICILSLVTNCGVIIPQWMPTTSLFMLIASFIVTIIAHIDTYHRKEIKKVTTPIYKFAGNRYYIRDEKCDYILIVQDKNEYVAKTIPFTRVKFETGENPMVVENIEYYNYKPWWPYIGFCMFYQDSSYIIVTPEDK